MSNYTYRWAFPSEWLDDFVNLAVEAGDVRMLRGIINSLVNKLDEDAIQDAFNSDMERSNYFIPLEEQAGDGDED